MSYYPASIQNLIKNILLLVPEFLSTQYLGLTLPTAMAGGKILAITMELMFQELFKT